MLTTIERHIPIAGTFNIRDLGGYAHADGTTRWRSLLRADGLHRIDAEGIAQLKMLGVTTVIDLRRVEELERQPNPFAKEQGVTYHNISLFEALAPAAMGSDDVLYDLYVQALDSRGDRFLEVLRTIAAAPEGIVLFHCTAGKDRTGLVAALLLALAGVDDATIVEDYALTGKLLEPALAGLLADAASRGVEAETLRPLLACDPATMTAALAHLSTRYGSPANYLARIGIRGPLATGLKARLSEAG